MKTLIIGQPSETLPLQLHLSSPSHEIIVTDQHTLAADYLNTYDFDAVLITENGPVNTKAIRATGFNRALLVFAPPNSPLDDMLTCFREGADDYQLRPIPLEILKARLLAVSRRYRGITSSILTYGPLTVNLDTEEVRLDGSVLHLTRTEFRLLSLLASNPNRVLTKERILQSLYPIEADAPEIKIIDVFICKLRKKLNPHGSLIGTIWGRGYALQP